MKRLCSALLISTLASPATALSITNLDDTPHRIGIQSIGGEERVETIAAGKTIYLYEPRQYLFNLDLAEPVRILANNDEEYTIWGNGELQLQRYTSQTTRGMN